MAMSRNGYIIAAACTDALRVYDWNGTLLYTYAAQMTCVDVSPGFYGIAACDKQGDKLYYFEYAAGPTFSLQWTETGNYFWVATGSDQPDDNLRYVAASMDGYVYLYDEDGKLIWSYGHWHWDSSDFIRIDMDYDSGSFVAGNDNWSNNEGRVLCYWNHMYDGYGGWLAGDARVIYSTLSLYSNFMG